MSTGKSLSAQLTEAIRAWEEALLRSASPDELQAASAEVDRLKAQVNDRLDEITAEIDELRAEVGAQQVKYETGKYTEAQFRNATASARRRISSLERMEDSFNALLQMGAEADEAHPTIGTPLTAESSVSSSLEQTSYVEMPGESEGLSGAEFEASDDAEDATPEWDYIPRKRGLDAIPAPKWMLIGSGIFIGAGVIALIILLVQAVAGAMSLPALPSPSDLFGTDGAFAVPGLTSSPTSSPLPNIPAASTAPVGTEFQVPVQLHNARGLGSLYLELSYDAAVIEVLALDFAALPANTLADHELGNGRIVIGLVAADGLTGNWSIAVVTFRKVLDQAVSGEATIDISALVAHAASDLGEVVATGSDGHVDMITLAVDAPAVTFG